MKKRLLKRLFVFTLIMFSFSYLHAQCPGNKVLMYKQGRAYCTSQCVPANQVQKYISKGWSFYCNTSGFPLAKSANKVNAEKVATVRPKEDPVKK